MKNDNNKNGSVVPRLILFWLVILILFLICTTPSYALILKSEDIKWSDDSNTYKLTMTDSMVTEKDYTIKAVEFPSAVRGYKTINGSIYTERPVSQFVRLELYKNIVSNPSPIASFTIGIGEEYILPDQDTRITINDIPGPTSQDWVYEYYNPWVIIKIQTRSIPNLDISINLTHPSGEGIDDENIRSGSNINTKITIKNTGNDFIDNVTFNIDPGQLSVRDASATNKLIDTLFKLNKDEKKIVDLSLMIPVSLEEKEYKIQVNTTGQDVKGVIYNFNASRVIKVKSDIAAIYVEKRISRNTSYLKEYVGVVLNIVNTGHTIISNIQIHDAIPDRLILVKDGKMQSYTEFFLNRSALGPSESWTIGYSLKPVEPGIYILPKFDINFSIGDSNLEATSDEVGFRVFGPHVVLTKSARDMGNGTIEVIVTAKNVGNGPTRSVINDSIFPDGTYLTSGTTATTIYLDPNTEKTMSYTISSSDTNISNLIWSPAMAIYYLDDWKFNTSSDEKYEGGYRIEENRPLEGGTRAHIIILEPVTTPLPYVEVTVPKIQEEQRRVVATITKTPAQASEKSISGFIWSELIFLSTVIIFSRILKMNLRNK